MLTVDISLPDVEELQKLVTDGQEKGFLTYDEIVNGLDDVELTKEQVEDFYTYLIDHGVELVEGIEELAVRDPPRARDRGLTRGVRLAGCDTPRVRLLKPRYYTGYQAAARAPRPRPPRRSRWPR